MTARITFEHELKILHNDLKKMGIMIEGAIDRCMEAFENQDEVLAREVIAGDRMINDMEKTIETECLSLILKQQPVARDLRQISSALKMISDMERIGDQASDIAEIVSYINADSTENFNLICLMAESAIKMVTESVEAYVRGDVKLAKAAISHDDAVDDYFEKVRSSLVTMITEHPDKAKYALDLLMIAKYFERIGDHAVNIAEWVVFSVTGFHKGESQ